MSVSAKIKFTQGGLNPAPGIALIGVLTTPVVVTNADNSNVEIFQWEVIDKPPTSAVPSGIVAVGPVSSFTFVPDQPGGYHIHLRTTDLAGNTSDDFRVFQVPEPSGYVIPPFDALAPALNFSGQKRGWAKAMEELLRHLLAGAGGGGAVVFDDAVPADKSTIRSDRLKQNPVDNPKLGITNLSSDSIGTSPGVVAAYATIGGGDRSDIDANSSYGTIGGGFKNAIKGQFGTVGGGNDNQAGSEFDVFGTEAVVCGGSLNRARGWDSVIAGGTSNTVDPAAVQGLICGGQNGTVSAQNGTIINGYFCAAIGAFSTAHGDACLASGFHSYAKGVNTVASRPFQSSEGQYGGGLGAGAQSCRMAVSFVSATSTNSDFTLDDGVAYLVRVSCTMKQIAGAKRAGFERTMLVHGAGGVAVIDQDIAGPNNAALNMGSGYTLVMSVAGNAIVATLNGGADAFNAGLLYEWVEANDAL